MQSDAFIQSPNLKARYSLETGWIAFLDESYREERSDEAAFYLVSCVALLASNLDLMRLKLFEAAQSTFWHTTSSYQEGRYQAMHKMYDLLADDLFAKVVTFQTEVKNGDLEHARRVCLLQIAATLEDSGVRLLLLEQRNTRFSRNSDRALIERSRRAGLLRTRTSVIQTTPSQENLLWAPDLVCWAVRRKLALDENRWFAMVSTQVDWLNANSERRNYLPFGKLSRELAPAIHPSDLDEWLEREFPRRTR